MKTLKLTVGWVVLLQLLVNCSGQGRSLTTMPPEDRQFLSEVRYIISKKEIKIFKNTPVEERKQFIEEFWKERDPSPASEENEFRDEYYRRIEQANHLFREGSSGWLTDRGRIYILLGEPDRRITYPSGYSFYEPPVEIWYYSQFAILFIDYEHEGLYKLDPSSASITGTINMAQMRLKPKGITRNVRLFDFSLTAQNTGSGQVTLSMEIPYRVINLFQNDKTGTLETQIKLTVRVSNKSGEKVLEKEELHPVSVSKDLLAQLGKNHAIQFTIELPPGKYSAQVSLENTADRSHALKEIKFEL